MDVPFGRGMRLLALIGTLVVLIVPFSFISITSPNITTTVFMGFLYYSQKQDVSINFFDNQKSGTFQFDWLKDGGLYHSYFDPLFAIGVLLVLVLLANIGIAVVSSKQKNARLPALILILAGIGILILRLVALGDNNGSFYTTRNTLFGEQTYLEIPIGLIWALIFGLLDMRQK